MTPDGQAAGTRPDWAGWVAAAALAGCWLDAAMPSWRLSPDLGHAWAVPVLIGFLYWERWPERPASRGDEINPRAPRSQTSAMAIPPPAATFAWIALGLLLAGAVPVRLLLTPYPLWPAALLVYVGIIATLASLAGWQTGGRAGARWVLRPLLLTIACLPIPSVLENGLLLPLRTAIAAVVADVSNALGHPALAAGTSIRLAHGWVGVEEACSGIRSLQAALLFGLFFGEWYRFRWTRRIALIALSLAAAIGGNFARVLFLTLYTAGGGAFDRVHDPAGWTAMIASLALTSWLAVHWAAYRLPAASLAAPPARGRTPRAWLWATAIGLGAISAGTHLWFRSGGPASTAAQWTARLPVNHWSFQPEPLSDTARALLRPDHFASGRWKDSGDREIESYFVEWTHGQVARSVPFLHNPTVCLPYAGCELMATLGPIDVPSAAGPVRFFVYRFQRTGQSLLVAFTIWDPSRGQLLEHPEAYPTRWQWLRRQWRDVREHRRDQPAQLLAVSMTADETARGDLARLLRTLVVSPSVAVRPEA